MMPVRRGRLLGWTVLFWLAAAFVVWNGFFDILVTRGEKQYLLSQARYELGVAPPRTIDEVMTRTIADARRIASIWGGIVLAAGIGSTLIVARVCGRGRNVAAGL
jgi:hypothetical protein